MLNDMNEVSKFWGDMVVEYGRTDPITHPFSRIYPNGRR